MQEYDYDVIVVLGAQVGVDELGEMRPAVHTDMRARAAAIAWQRNMTERFIVSGGYNVGVRYDLDLKVPIFGRPGSDRQPDFSEEAKQRARVYRSEASIIAEVMRKEYDVPSEALIFEEDSDTTSANAKKTKEILERLGVKRVAILTLLYHMEKALEEFRKVGVDAVLVSVFAEDILALDHTLNWAAEIVDYYKEPRGSKQWDAERIREIMQARAEGELSLSVGELLQ